MTEVERSGDDLVVAAQVLADAFGLTQEEVRDKMRNGAITSRSETGMGDDVGRWRLTFHHERRALRLVVDDRGTILKRASFPIRIRQAVVRLGA
ncbi:MAG: hypothetical protein CVT70_15325 [Alphaproteobacteria bacterium HGW-Alphaproteobacteria-1]|nr:MAG: hypothetical protein CVT70_15325 [Alphaproteobacteria bacterium HGW-Alphaproteobacteria-1]